MIVDVRFADASGLLEGDVSPLERAGYAQDKDARSANSSAICATEDAVLCRPERSGGRDFVFQQPSRTPAADEPAILEEIEIEDLAVDGICGVY